MIQRLVYSAPASALSLGQVGFNILRELYRRKIQVVYYPIGQPDFSPFRVDPQFGQWIERAVNSRYERLDRKVPGLKVWHLRDGESKVTDRQWILSFHETDSPTPNEVNIANQQDGTLFTSNWTVDNFRTYGATNVSFVPLGLDEDFVPTNERLVDPGITHWILVGKHEDLRKMTSHKIGTWIKRYGGKREHMLTVCVDNPFYQRERCGFTTEDLLGRLFAQCGGKPFNVNVLPHLKTNAEMLRLYQSADVDLSGYARAEGWNLPSFTATALGKWSIVSNCSAHKDWATAENSILIEPTGFVKAVDGIFFAENAPFSSGNMFDFAPDAFDQALVRAEAVAKTPNLAGAMLRETHTYAKTVDAVLAKIGD